LGVVVCAKRHTGCQRKTTLKFITGVIGARGRARRRETMPHMVQRLFIALTGSAKARWGWRVLLALMVVTICWLAFDPHPPPRLSGPDKPQHAAAFLALTVCAALSWSLAPRRDASSALALLAFGLFIEAVQSQIPGRSAEWQDLVADAAGIAAGSLVVWSLRRSLPMRPG
jgi:VanZ family protein